MNTQTLHQLQRLFWILGWILMVSLILEVGLKVGFHVWGILYETDVPPYLKVSGEFDLLMEVKNWFHGLAEAFFAILVSKIFGMLSSSANLKHVEENRFLDLTCLSFVAEGLIKGVVFVRFLVLTGSLVSDGINNSNYRSLVDLAMNWLWNGVSIFMPFLYAITIFVLYRHYSRLINFESEVV